MRSNGAIAGLVALVLAGCGATGPTAPAPVASPASTSPAASGPHATSVVQVGPSATAAIAQATAAPPPTATSATPGPSPTASHDAAIALGPVPAEPLPDAVGAQLQELIEETAAAQDLPGIAAAVITASGTWAGTTGSADPATDAALDPAAQFALASITKTFVAALVLQQVDAGTMDLDAPLATYLPPELEAIANGATVRQALEHRSGIAEHVDEAFIDELLDDCARRLEPKDVAARIGPRVAPPGITFAYTNSNYTLLGMALERTAGAEVGVLTRDLLDPLDLPGIVFQADEPPVPPLALPFFDRDQDGTWDELGQGGLLPCRSVATGAWAAGGMAGDALSVASWGWLLYGGSLLSDESLAAMTNTADDGYGLGTAFYAVGAPAGVGHSGGMPGYVTELVVLPRQRVAMAVLVNANRDPGLQSLEVKLLQVARQ